MFSDRDAIVVLAFIGFINVRLVVCDTSLPLYNLRCPNKILSDMFRPINDESHLANR